MRFFTIVCLGLSLFSCTYHHPNLVDCGHQELYCGEHCDEAKENFKYLVENSDRPVCKVKFVEK